MGALARGSGARVLECSEPDCGWQASWARLVRAAPAARWALGRVSRLPTAPAAWERRGFGPRVQQGHLADLLPAVTAPLAPEPSVGLTRGLPHPAPS